MATALILYVGDDTCSRVRIFERAGLGVIRSRCTVKDIEDAVKGISTIDAAVFHNDHCPIDSEIFPAIHGLISGPLILFETPDIACDESAFDLVIAPLTPPQIWLSEIAAAIHMCRYHVGRSRELCAEAANARMKSHAIRLASSRLRVLPIKLNAIWRGDPDSKG